MTCKFLLSQFVFLALSLNANADHPLPSSGLQWASLSERSLERLITDRDPPAQGAESLFSIVKTNPDIRVAANDFVNRSVVLSKAAQEGSNFRQSYLDDLRSDFGQANLDFVIQPYLATARWLEDYLSSRRQIVIKLPTEEVAYAIAWENTQRQFGIPPFVSPIQLEQRAQTDLDAHEAFQFLKREQARRLQIEEQSLQKKPPDVAEFKAEVVSHLRQLRLKNINGYLARYSKAETILGKVKRPAFRLKAVRKEDRRSFSELDLGQAIAFLSLNLGEPTHQVVIDGERGRLDQFLFDWLQKDFFAAGPQPWAKLFPRTNIKFLDKNDSDALVISESAIYPLFSLASRMHSGRPGNLGNDKWRYILEAGARDVLFRSLEQFLLDLPDADFQSLAVRLREKIESFKSVLSVQLPLTSRINRDGLSEPDTRLSWEDLFWFGLGKHPDYWFMRDQVAAGMRLPNIENLKNIKSDVDALKHFGSEGNEVKSWGRKWDQTLQKDNRYLKMTKAFVAVPLVMYGLLGGYSFFPPHGSDEFNYTIAPSDSPKWVKSSFGRFAHEITESLRNFFGDDDGDSDNMSDQLTQRTLDDEHEIQNYDIKGIKKSTKDKTPLFIIDRNTRFQTPSYLNLVNKINFPAGFFENTLAADRSAEPAGVVYVAPISFSSVGRDSVTVTAAVPVAASRGRVPIASFSGWELVNLTVEIHEHLVKGAKEYINVINLSRDVDYRVYRLPTHGLYYLELTNDKFVGKKFIYSAHLQKGEEPYTDLLPPELPKAGVEDAALAARRIGASEVTMALRNLARKPEPVQFQSLVLAVSKTGYYSDRGLKIKQDKDPWKVLVQLVHDGEFVYQCTGAGELMDQILNASLRLLPVKAGPVVAQPIYGFYIGQDQTVRAEQGHRHTIVTRLDQPNQFIELDGTPVRHENDRKYFVSRSLPLAPSRSRPSHENSESELEELVKKANQAGRRDRVVFRLIELQADAIQLVEKNYFSIFKNMSEKEFSQDIGGRALVTSQIMIDLHDDKISQSDAIRKLVVARFRLPQDKPLSKEQEAWLTKKLQSLTVEFASYNEMLKSFFKDELTELMAEIEKVESLKNSNSGFFHYLLIESLAAKLTEIDQTLVSQDWINDLSPKSCDKILNNDMPEEIRSQR